MRLAASQNASVKSHKKWGPGISGRLGSGGTHACLFFTARVVSFKNCQRIGDLCNLVKVIVVRRITSNLAIVRHIKSETDFYCLVALICLRLRGVRNALYI